MAIALFEKQLEYLAFGVLIQIILSLHRKFHCSGTCADPISDAFIKTICTLGKITIKNISYLVKEAADADHELLEQLKDKSRKS